jgi:hypothetical protein
MTKLLQSLRQFDTKACSDRSPPQLCIQLDSKLVALRGLEEIVVVPEKIEKLGFALDQHLRWKKTKPKKTPGGWVTIQTAIALQASKQASRRAN